MSSVATTQRPPGTHERRGLSRRRAVRLFEPGRATLDDRISALWQQLVEHGTADCPVCGTTVHAGRECGGCGSELA